jgi:hypothetical protein
MIQVWPWPHLLCKLAPFATSLNVNVSVLTLAAISLDRFYVIYFPLKPKLRSKHFVYIMTAIWAVSLSVSSYNLFVFEIKNKTANDNNTTPEYRCDLPEENNNPYFLPVQTFIQFVFPLLILSFSFLAIYYRIYLRRYEGPVNFYVHSKQSVNRRKVIKMILIVLLVFAVCWTPLQAYNVSVIMTEGLVNNYYYINVVWLVFNLLAMSNSCYSVFIYGMCSVSGFVYLRLKLMDFFFRNS